MMRSTFDIKKFNGNDDFGLWRIKMCALLIQHGCEAALEVLTVDIEAEAKAELNKKAHSAVILCLGNKVLREVTGETTAAGVWTKLETLYMKRMKILLYYYSLLYQHHMYEHFVNTLLYGREALTLEDVIAILDSKEIKERSKAKEDNGEGLYVRDHLKRNCLKNNRKKSTCYIKKDEQPSSSGSIYDSSKVMMVMSVEALLDWIMVSGGLYHMMPKLDIFYDFLECNRGSVLLGDKRQCKIRDIGKKLDIGGNSSKEGYTIKLQLGKVKAINSSRFVLSGTRRDCVCSLDGHAVAGELNASVEEKDSLTQIWCKRLGHINEAGLHVLEKQELFGKKSLELWGLSQVESLGGKRYFLSIVDDYSRRVWVYILRFKHEAFGKFKEWKQLVENQIGRTVKKLRTDNGLEFCNREFKQLCTEGGIARHLTVVGTPQQNGSPSTEIEKRHLWRCGYLEDVKGYRLYMLDDESPKIVTTKNVVFNEMSCTKTHQEDGDDEDARDQETDQTPDLTDYQLVQDREPRTKTKPLRFRDESNIVAYAFVAPEEEDTHEPLTYQEAVACEDSSKWKAAMKEEMDSLRMNETLELVDHLAGQKLVSCKWLFKIKEWIKGVQNPRYMARLVARGFTQRVDDMLIACKSKAEIGSTKSLFKNEFDMKELRKANKIHGMEIVRDQSPKILRVSQFGYISKILNNFRIDNRKSVQMPLGRHFKVSLKGCPFRDCDVEKMSKASYANAVGSLMYLMVYTRPNIAYTVSVVSRCLTNLGKNHWEALKWILRYLWGTSNVGLVYGTDRGNHVDVTGFIDSDYAKDLDKRCVVSWKATLQHVVALSTIEVEYMALTKAVKEAIWLRGLLEELGVELNIVTVNCDNQGAIHLSRNCVFHERAKHISVRHHFIREVLEAKTVKVLKVDTKHIVADGLTKVVPGLKLQHCLEFLSVDDKGNGPLKDDKRKVTGIKILDDLDLCILHSSDEILDDLLEREFNKQHRVKVDDKEKGPLKDDKRKVTGFKILDDLEQRIENVEKDLNKSVLSMGILLGIVVVLKKLGLGKK
ncbi:zinc finger, CCHC-type containing protein [Tanacetum coccineum]